MVSPISETMGYGFGVRRYSTFDHLRLRCRIIGKISFLVAICHLHTSATGQDSVCQDLAPSPTLEQFVDELPIPATTHVNTTRITIGAWKIEQKLHRDLPPTTLYAYGQTQETAIFPANTLEATRGIPANIYWENHIPDKEHFLPLDRTIHWANPKSGVPIVVHLHGAEVQSTYDGQPDSWWTSEKEYGPAYTTQNYTYPNNQRPTMLWYHDHVVGITRLNVLAGMVGLYMLRSQREKHLTEIFQPGKYEIPLVLKDYQFWPNGSINFPNIGDSPEIHPIWCPEYFGDTIVVNGKAWPYLNIYPRFYRFRILNGGNARFFNLSMSNPAMRFIKIGTDGGFLEGPVEVVSSLLMAPAERLDILVDFSHLKPGDVVYFNNSAPAPFPSGTDSFSPPQTNSVLKIQVIARPQDEPNPSTTDIITAISEAMFVYTPPINYTNALHRYLVLVEYDDADDNPIVSTLGNRTWTDPVTETPEEGAVEVWELINTTPDAHPIHVHLIQFHVLNQQPFDEQGYMNGSCDITIPFFQQGTCFLGPPIRPAIYHHGFKDTATVWPGNVTRYGMRFATAEAQPFSFDPSIGPGYVWHCHILDHEDNDMMRPYKITKWR